MFSTIKKIIEDGIKAPSGENCQPWKFTWDGAKVSLFNVPEADFSLYNTGQKGSYLAHGALLENMSLSANHYGYDAHITLFPVGDNDETHVADITFSVSSPSESPHYEAISLRCTNRKEYYHKKLSEETVISLVESVKGSVCSQVIAIDDPVAMQSFGVALALHEKVLFENRSMHDFFYNHILWNKSDEKKAGGFYIDTLEFLPHELRAVKLLKHWPVLKVLNALFKVSTMISRDNGKKYSQGGAFFVLMMKGDALSDYVSFGMAVQRFWLEATARSLAVHPCNGTLYLMRYLEQTKEPNLSSYHIQAIRDAYQRMINFASEKEDVKIGFVFRVGEADAPSAVATRLPASIENIVP